MDKIVGGAGAFLCCGVRIDAWDLDAAAAALTRRPGAAAVHLCNAYTLSLARGDPSFAALLNRGDANFADGMPLVWIGKRLGLRDMSRVYGPDLMTEVMDRGRESGLRHYLYGSTPEVVAELGRRLRVRFPGVSIVGEESPPFRPLAPEEEQATAARISAARPDVVWVGLGTPKQDAFVDVFRDRVEAPLVTVGAAFDFHAGTLRQAPRWMQDHGLEWGFRLAAEPRRLWRRYLVGNARFLTGVIRDPIETVPESLEATSSFHRSRDGFGAETKA